MATHASTTRRTAIATMAGAALTGIVSPAGSAPPFTAEPTARGRRFLRYVTLHQLSWAKAPSEDDEAGWAAHLARINRYNDELSAIGAEIIAKPVTSVSDVIDRLILVAHECDPAFVPDREQVLPALGGVLAVAGIKPSQCCVGDFEDADELAA